ncbi:hypothetical protein R6Q57_024327 [Mikania cordata]
MSNPYEKESVEQYHSQPTKNSLSWVSNKWRRLSFKHSASSSVVPKTSRDDANVPMDGASKVPMDDTSKVHMENAPVNKESHSLSKDAIEFYNKGDAPFCYSRILGLNKLHTDFWGVLLGYLNDGRLSSIASRCQSFLGWLDPPMCPRAIVVIPGLLRSKNKLEDEVKQLKATIGKKNFIIFFFIVPKGLMFLF